MPAASKFVQGTTVIAVMDDATATDSATGSSGPSVATAPVSLTATAGQTVSIHVAPAQSWFDGSARVFPVTIGPDFHEVIATGEYAAGDTYVTMAQPTSNFSGSHSLQIGTSNGGATVARSELYFPLAYLEGSRKVHISKATLQLWNYWSNTCQTSASTQATVYALPAWNPTGETWNNQQAAMGFNPAITGNWVGRNDQGGACAQGYRNIDVTALARAWTTYATLPDRGLELRAVRRTEQPRLQAVLLGRDVPRTQARPRLGLLRRRVRKFAVVGADCRNVVRHRRVGSQHGTEAVEPGTVRAACLREDRRQDATRRYRRDRSRTTRAVERLEAVRRQAEQVRNRLVHARLHDGEDGSSGH